MMNKRNKLRILVMVLAFGLAAVCLAGCGSMGLKLDKKSLENLTTSYQSMAADFTHPDVAGDDSAILVFSSFADQTNAEEVAAGPVVASVAKSYFRINVTSLGGQTVDWLSKESSNPMFMVLTKAIIPAGTLSYLIETGKGVSLEGEMEFISGHVYVIEGKSMGDMPAPELKIRDLTAELAEVNAKLGITEAAASDTAAVETDVSEAAAAESAAGEDTPAETADVEDTAGEAAAAENVTGENQQ